MSTHPSPIPETELLPPEIADELLARASKIDVALQGARVAELRAAAVEAGISQHAFNAALAEIRQNAGPRELASPPSRRRVSTWVIAVAAGMLTLVLGAMFVRIVIPVRHPAGVTVPGPPLQEEVITLRCVKPEDAALVVRRILSFPGNMIRISSPESHVITLRATKEQMVRVRELIAQLEPAGSNACTSSPAPATSRER